MKTNTKENEGPVEPQALKRAVIYLRVSSSQQADKDFDKEGFSIPGQREACQREAAKLGAQVADEYIDRGESATTAKRPALRAMLDRLTGGDIDFVIVHKVDRLARNRADDVEIVMAIRQSGAQVVSVTENIDETPSGLLLHGIMSSIAEFYSRNLAAEVMKGTTQKAKTGGTPYKPPLGYLNTRTEVDGRDVRTVALDPDRAPLMRDAFQLYATGDYSLAELAALLEDRGLRSRPTRKLAERLVPANKLNVLLRNAYYTGVVPYAGKVYPGRHEPLVDEATFLDVQDLLTSKRLSGERPWRHFHYLRGTLYCAKSKRRLIFSKAKGHGGVYSYFVCGGKQHGTCKHRSYRAEAVEAAVAQHYASLEMEDDVREGIRAAVRDHVGAIAKVAAKQAEEAQRQITKLDREERKLLTAHYADRISESLFESEQDRIKRERASATRRTERLDFEQDRVLAALDQALELTIDIQRAYLAANPQERRLLNQGFFKRLEIYEEEVVAEQPEELRGQLAHLGRNWESQAAAPGANKDKTPSPQGTGGLNVEALVPLRGFEPRFPD